MDNVLYRVNDWYFPLEPSLYGKKVIHHNCGGYLLNYSNRGVLTNWKCKKCKTGILISEVSTILNHMNFISEDVNNYILTYEQFVLTELDNANKEILKITTKMHELTVYKSNLQKELNTLRPAYSQISVNPILEEYLKNYMEPIKLWNNGVF